MISSDVQTELLLDLSGVFHGKQVALICSSNDLGLVDRFLLLRRYVSESHRFLNHEAILRFHLPWAFLLATSADLLRSFLIKFKLELTFL